MSQELLFYIYQREDKYSISLLKKFELKQI